jgi:hypothetical protein
MLLEVIQWEGELHWESDALPFGTSVDAIFTLKFTALQVLFIK